MEQTVRIEFWEDESGGGRCHVAEFLDSLGEIAALEIAEMLEEGFDGRYLDELFRKEKIRFPQDGLLYLRIEHKGKKIRLIGCLRGNKIILVHGFVKKKIGDIPKTHIKSARERIKNIPENYGPKDLQN
ncbi:MAG: type II toxin-antitoxin system RelE/ParE family toxin [Candidatus Pacebacteria bacterium]|nr:type II toxin-antitoxin system RelE/ParE family toxin [Candidatus Paceibacterota bacterium]